ncbi:MAG: hypothetical protein WA951_03320 [Leeuwenhoekiella sp.]
MGWIKKGCIFTIEDQNITWAKTHACVPTAHLIDSETIRVFYAPRNKYGQSIPTFFDVSADDPAQIKYVYDKPIMHLGDLGTFDDGGIMPCCTVQVGRLIYMYYVGWNPSSSVPYRNAIGLAISEDDGNTFRRPYPGALVDRNRLEPYFTASPWVMREKEDDWHMWYASSTGFVTINGSVEPLYIIKYAHSKNGIDWERDNKTCIMPKSAEEANARATVFKENGAYHMWYAYRGSRDFRDGKDAYQLGYAKSADAINWERQDDKVGIEFSKTGWDSSMQTYPCIIKSKDKRYLFYNGNGFGATGIGYAVWDNQ